MTVYELIKELNKHYAHTKVLISIRGEDGMQDYTDVTDVSEMLIRANGKTEVSIVLS